MKAKQVNGWIVLTDRDSPKIVPVRQQFFVNKVCAEALKNEMNTKKSLDPVTYIYPYKMVKATLIVKA
jgi:hypothetical protein